MFVRVGRDRSVRFLSAIARRRADGSITAEMARAAVVDPASVSDMYPQYRELWFVEPDGTRTRYFDPNDPAKATIKALQDLEGYLPDAWAEDDHAADLADLAILASETLTPADILDDQLAQGANDEQPEHSSPTRQRDADALIAAARPGPSAGVTSAADQPLT